MFDKILNRKKKPMEEQKIEIQELGLNAIKEFFKIEPKNMNPEFLKILHHKAKIGMQFEKEMNVSTRAVEMNYIRVFRLIAEDKTQMKEYIKKSMPQYFPIEEKPTEEGK